MVDEQKSAAALRRQIQRTYLGDPAPDELMDRWVTQELVEQAERIVLRNALLRAHWEALRGAVA